MAQRFLAHMTELDLRGSKLAKSPVLVKYAEEYALSFVRGEEAGDEERLRRAAKRLVDVVVAHDVKFDKSNDNSWPQLRRKS